MPLSSTLHSPRLMEEPELFSVPGVEVFAEGEWNGHKITSKDLDDIVEAYSQTSQTLPPFLKLGHSDEQTMLIQEGLPAAGWVQNVRRSGGKLVADFVNIPKKIFKLLKAKAYRKVSAEIYRNVKIGDKTYPRLLGAVALLGAETPAVMNLEDIMARYGYVHAGAENFALDFPSAILLERSTIQQPEGDSMPKTEEQTPDVMKFQLDQANKLLADAQKALDAEKAEKDKYKAQADAAVETVSEKDKEIEKFRLQAVEADVASFVSSLKADKLCTKAMEPLVRQLVNPVEKFSHDGKELSQKDVLRQVIKFASEAGKVNFDEQTTHQTSNETKPSDQAALKAQIDKYSADHKVSWKEAYKAVTKEMDLTPPRMADDSESEEA